jgi:hypothetical protein
MERWDLPARDEAATATANAGHPTQKLGRGYGRIVLGHRVAPGNPRKAILKLLPFDRPVNDETAVAQN